MVESPGRGRAGDRVHGGRQPNRLCPFYRVDTVAGLLVVPYLLWVSFAAALNLAVWKLNAGLTALPGRGQRP